MSVAFKPDVSTLQIVEVDVSTPQKMGKPSRVIRSYSAEQIPVTRGMNRLSQKLGVLRQPGKPSRINASCVAKVWCESPFSRYTFATSFFEFQLHPPNAPLTSTLKSDNGTLLKKCSYIKAKPIDHLETVIQKNNIVSFFKPKFDRQRFLDVLLKLWLEIH